MIYLLQPQNYHSHLAEWFVRQIQSYKYKDEVLIQSHCPQIDLNKTAFYFIILDNSRKDWEALKIAHFIRSQDPIASIILVTNYLDYQFFYRSHLSLFDIIDLNDPFENLEECLLYIYSSKLSLSN